MSDRHMSSIFPECDQLKQIYDRCFTEFFQKFVSPNYRHQSAINPCERLHEVYRQCVDEMNPDSLPNPQLIDSVDVRFNQLERTIEQFQENVRHMGIIASDFTSKSQEPLNQKIQTLISGLQEIDQIRNQFQDVRIPIELLTDVLDYGKNPQVYTKEVLERTLEQNKKANGKVEILKKFQALLLREYGEQCPEDALKYREARKMDNTENSSS